MEKLVSDLKVGDKVYMCKYPTFPDTTIGRQPRITTLIVEDIENCSGLLDYGYAIFTMKLYGYHPNCNFTYRMKAEVIEVDETWIIGDEGREINEKGEYVNNWSDGWYRTFFTTYQAAVNHIVHHYESGVLDYLRCLRSFKKEYGNADYDFFQMKTKEYSEDYHTYTKYEITGSDKEYPKKIRQEIEDSKYFIYSREVELDHLGRVKTWGAPWLYQSMDPILMCDTLEEASTWVAAHDKSKDEYMRKVTQYSIREVKKLKTKKF